MAFSTTTPTYPTSFPVFGGSPRNGSCQLANADSTTPKDFSNFTPAAAGTRVNEITIQSGPTTAPGAIAVAILVHDGTNARVIKNVTLTNTANLDQFTLTFNNLILPTGYKLQAVARTAVTSGGTVDIIVQGVDLQVAA